MANNGRRLRAAIIGLALGALLPASAQSATIQRQSSVVPNWIARAQKVGTANSEEKVLLSAYLGFRDVATLKAMATAVSHPGSPQYGHFLTPAQFRQRFAPDPQKVALVRRTFEKLGFAVEHVPTSGFYVQVSGTVDQVRKAFRVSQNLYKVQGRILRGAPEVPTLPTGLAGAVMFVGGLSEDMRRPSHIIEGRRPAAASAVARTLAGAKPFGSIQPEPWFFATRPICSVYWGDHGAHVTPTPTPFAANLPWEPCGYKPDELRKAYGAPKKGGDGMRIAIVDAFASPTIRKDANQYFRGHGEQTLVGAQFGQNVPLGIDQDSTNAETCEAAGWFVEETLDVEAVHAMAPRANILYVGSIDCFSSIDDALYDTIDNASADIISNSWGLEGEASADEENVRNEGFLQAALEGITVLFSSGDFADNLPDTSTAIANWPASSPLVTAVGGTSLAYLNSTGAKQEFGWGTFQAIVDGADLSDPNNVTGHDLTPFFFASGSGGGPSALELQPGWQLGIVPDSLSMFTHDISGNAIPLGDRYRVTPDIAMVGDPQTGMLIGETFTVATPGGDTGCTLEAGSTTFEYCEFVIGGTSLSTPLFAGVMAIVDQKRIARGLSALGFASEALYAMKVGSPGGNQGIVDVLPPGSPMAVLRPNPADPGTPVSVRTINQSDTTLGADGFSLRTTSGFDNVTGLGIPWIPKFVSQLTKN